MKKKGWRASLRSLVRASSALLAEADPGRRRRVIVDWRETGADLADVVASEELEKGEKGQ